VDRFQRFLLVFMVAVTAAPGLVGGRLLALVAFAHDLGEGPVNVGTLLATIVCVGACGHVWQRPTRSLVAWAGLCVVVTILGGAAFWLSGTLVGEPFAVGNLPLAMLAGALFAGPFLAVLGVVQTVTFVAAMRFSGAWSREAIRTDRLAMSALGLTLLNGVALVLELRVGAAG